MLMMLINSLKDSPVVAMETTMVFFREMMDMPAVREIMRDNLLTIMKLVIFNANNDNIYIDYTFSIIVNYHN